MITYYDTKLQIGNCDCFGISLFHYTIEKGYFVTVIVYIYSLRSDIAAIHENNSVYKRIQNKNEKH